MDTFDGVRIDPASFALAAGYTPQHGTVSFDPATGFITYTPDFGYAGFDTFRYTLSDTTGFWHTFADEFVPVSPSVPRLQADPLGGQMLVVDGTPGNDTILVTPGPRKGDVYATENGVTAGPFRPTSRVVAFGYGGDDRITVSGRVAVPVWLDGGPGNDTLIAGGGPTILLGGPGNATLLAGTDRDVMVGGTGADTLAGRGDDLIVTGTTSFDADRAALAGEADRKAAGRLNGSTYLTAATVQNDGAADTVHTGGRQSLTFSSPGDVVKTRAAHFDRLDGWADHLAVPGRRHCG